MTENNIKETLELYAKKKAAFDDPSFSTFDYSGGNIDDAYSLGLDDGEISFARELLKKIFLH